MSTHKRPPIPVIVLVVLLVAGLGGWWWWSATRPAADAGVSAVKLAASGVRSNKDVERMLPAFGGIIAPYLPRGDQAAAPGSAGTPVRLPVSKIATANPRALCDRVNRQSPGACSVVDGAARIADVNLLQLVMAQGGRP